jgi:AGCS family alanine or glycine:cation symporter
VMNLTQIPSVLVLIVTSAFKPAAEVGGFAGGAFIFMLTWGVKRGLFSNESGQGSAPIAHAAAKTDEPVREGVVAMMGPLIDTLIICSITGLVILTTGVWTDRQPDAVALNAQSDITVVVAGSRVLTNGKTAPEDEFTGVLTCRDGRAAGVAFVRNHSLVFDASINDGDGHPYSGEIPVADGTVDFGAIESLTLAGQMAQNGSPLTAWAFKRGLSPIFGNWGFLIVTLGVLLFGVSTAISWSYYGDRATVYLLGARWVRPYKLLFCVMHFLGAIFSLEIVWNFGDSALGLMAFPNLIALVLLARTTRAMTNEYFSRKHRPYR